MMNAPAAVFCMTQKGETDAVELLVDLQTQPSVGQIAYFVLGNDDDEVIEKILDLGVDDYFSPPISVENVVAKLKRAFNRNLNYDSTPPMDAGHMPGPPPIPSTGFMEDMILAAGLGEEHEHVEPDGTLGKIGDIKVFDVLQNLIVRKKSIRLSIDGETQGHIDVKEGHVCGAFQENQEGEAAFFNLIQASEGMLTIETVPVLCTENVMLSTNALLVKAHQALIKHS